MPFSLSSSALNDYQRFLSLLVGNDAYVDTPPLTVDYLVIAGGGGGGSSSGGGGGAGGYRSTVTGESSGGGASAETPLSLTPGTNYTVTVGAGGTGNASSLRGVVGNSSIFSSITSDGGGGGAGTSGGQTPGGSGGSGGGSFQGLSEGSGTANQGFDGGTSLAGDTAGGGGGAGAVGGSAVSGQNGAGGAGVSSAITGSSVGRAGGGGGGGVSGQTAGTATDGGGAGSTGGNGTSGTANTGGGGGGAYWTGSSSTVSGSGGSGVVILKYPIAYDMTVSAGLGYKTVMYGEYKITEFTAGTGTVSFALAPTVTGFSEDILQEIVLEDSAASVTFANLDQYASTYQHLQIRMTARTNRPTGSNANVNVQFNSDTGSNYAQHYLLRTTSLVSGGSASTSSIYLGGVPVASTAANAFGAYVYDILDPFETTKYTTIRALGGFATGFLGLHSGLWMNTNALTSLEIIGEANFIAGSRFTLIGVK